MGREGRPPIEWSGASQDRGGFAGTIGPVAFVVGGILRWLLWIVLILLLPVILTTAWITIVIMIVLLSPLIVFGAMRRGRPFWRTIGGLLMIPIEQRALVAPPKTYFIRRMFGSAARKW